MTFYFTDPEGRFAESSEQTPPTSGGPWTEVTSSDFRAAVSASESAIEAARQEAGAAANAALQTKAQAVYDEIVGIHPVSALALAQLVYPGFEA